MSVYDYRDRPAYRDWDGDPVLAEDEHIRCWWTREHDALLARAIAQRHWMWYWAISDEIVEITPPAELDRWRGEDPICQRWAWNNALMYFAVARAKVLGLDSAIREPEWKVCPLCGKRFVEDSLPYPLVERLGIDQLDFCSPCLRDTVLAGSGSEKLGKSAVLKYLRGLTQVAQCVPSAGIGEGIENLRGLAREERIALVKVLKGKPSTQRVKALFGSWFAALVAAGVLEEDSRRLSRGTQCLAKDGHVCFSLGEKTIDDLLHSLGIEHQKEPSYPDSRLRADFRIGDVLVEYFGLVGDSEYDEKTKRKKAICARRGIKLIALYPNDLANRDRLQRLITEGLAGTDGGQRQA